MRKAFAILIAILITVQAWSASVTGGNEVMPGLFYSEEELSHISFSDELTDSERDYYDSIDIKLITAAPAEPVYIYFGHSGLSVSVPGTEPVVFDYGTFSFSESFYHDFIFGLLYYSVSETYESWRLSEFEYEKQTVMLAPASGFYTSPDLGRNEVRIAYVLKKEDLASALVVLRKALEAYPGRTL